MNDRPAGPLRLPISPPTKEATRAVRKLRGHCTAANWLPEGLWPELDSARAEQLRVRAQVAAELAALEALTARFRDENQQHDLELQQAQRDSNPASVEDRRTPSDQRQAERAAVEERLWAGVIVLAEVVDSVIELVREHEDDWLADLRAQLVPAQEKRRDAQRLLDEAKAEEWQKHQLGAWVQKTSQDGPFGALPALIPGPPPKQFSAETARSMLEVPWHRNRPWKGEGEEPVRPWQEVSEEQAEEATPRRAGGVPAGDPTGQVSALEETTV